jgi:predicted transcriptional regulator
MVSHTEKDATGGDAQNVTLRMQRRKITALDELAERMGTTRSSLIQIAIAEYLERRADKAVK